MLINFRTWKIINKVQFDIYFRENNRYGGSQLIASAEEVFFADSRFVIGLLDEFNIEETEGLENAYLLGISTILTAFFDHWEKMLLQVNLTPLLAENKKLFREKKQSYIKKIEWLLSCNYSNLSEQTVALLTERNDAIKNYQNKILCAEQLTVHQEEIISSVIHMFCNRLTGDRSLEQKYLNIMREGLSNIIEKGKRNPINER